MLQRCANHHHHTPARGQVRPPARTLRRARPHARTVGEVDDDANFAVGNSSFGAAHPSEASFVAERRMQTLAQRDGHVFGSMVIVDVRVARARHSHGEAAGISKLSEDLIEQHDTGRNLTCYSMHAC